MKLSKEDFQSLQQALLSAFPSDASLAQMVKLQLGENLAAIAGGDNLSDRTFRLIVWAESQGRIEALMRGASRANPGNPALRRFVERFGLAAAPVNGSAPSTPANLTQLRATLCRLYRDPHDIARVVDDAGLPRARIDFHGAAINVWHSVLGEASKHGKVPAIVDVARREYPHDPELAADTGPAPAPSSPQAAGGDDAYNRLIALLPAQFEEALFRLNVPTHQMSASTAPQAQRAIELVKYLTAQGPAAFARLERVLGLAPGSLAPPPSPVAQQPDPPSHAGAAPAPDRMVVGIITMTNDEREAVLECMGEYRRERPQKGETRYYYRSTLRLDDGREVDVVCVQTTVQGNNSAGAAVRDLMARWQPDYVLLVGIAGGIHKDVDIGDVVVADQILYYEMAKLVEGRHQLRSASYQPGVRLLNAAKLDARITRAWREKAIAARPDVSPPLRDPKVVQGPIGSGDKVVADASAEELARLRVVNDKVLAVEMEAGGVASALNEMGQPDRLLVIRGISDHANVHKNDAYQPYAAHAAATFAFTLIREI